MHISSTEPQCCPSAKALVHISERLLERAIEHFQRNGWARKSTLRKALGVSPRTATNVIAYLRDELQVLEKSGNGYVWTGNMIVTESGKVGSNSVVMKSGKSGKSGNDTNTVSISLSSARHDARKSQEENPLMVDANTDSETTASPQVVEMNADFKPTAQAGPLGGRPHMQVEDDNWLVYQIRISEMLKVIEIDNAKWVSDNRAIGLAHKNHRKLKRPLVHRDTSNIRSIARSLRRLSVRGSNIECRDLFRLEGRLTKHIPDWRSCMGDPIAMAVREYGSIPPWLTGDDYIPEPPDDLDMPNEQELEDREAYWLRAMEGADSPAAQEEDLTTQPTKEAPQVASAAQEFRREWPTPLAPPEPLHQRLDIEPAEPASTAAEEEQPAAQLNISEPLGAELPLPERIKDLLCRMDRSMSISAIADALSEEKDSVTVTLFQLRDQQRQVFSFPPSFYSPEMRFCLR